MMLEVLPDAPKMDGLFPGTFEGMPSDTNSIRGSGVRARLRNTVFGRSSFSLTVADADRSFTISVRDEGGIGAVHLGFCEGKTVEHTSWTEADIQFDTSDGNLSIEAVESDRLLRISRVAGAPVLSVHVRDATFAADLQLPVTNMGTTFGEHSKTRSTTTVTAWAAAVHGSLATQGANVDVSSLAASWSLTAGVCPRDCRFMAVTGVGRLEDGRLLGISFADGRRQADVHEAFVSLDGRLFGAERIRILLGGDVARDVWRLRSSSGELELKFRPKGSYGDDVIRRLGARFSVRNVIGTFSGRVPDAHGRTLIVKDVPGIGVDHRSW